LDPRLLVGLLDVHVLDADRARVRVAQHAEDVSQRHDALARDTACRELAVEVPDGEAPVDRVELFVGARLLEPEWIEVRDQVPAHAIHVDEALDRERLLDGLDRTFERLVVAAPARGFVRDAETREQLRVEVVLAEQQLVDAAEELAALGALDHAVVVGARQRDDLAHADLRERLRVGTFELDRVRDRSDADDHALARHQARHRVLRADGAGVRDRNGRAREVVDGELVGARLPDDVFVRGVERGEVEGVGVLDVGDEQRARPVVTLHVDREAEIDVLVAHDRGLAVDDAERRVHVPH
jgi:hypothetical protein